MSTNETLLQTPLHVWHQANGGRLVEFGGWSMPVQYTTIVDEHKAVRERVGLFDISHMGRLTFDGPGVLDWLERVDDQPCGQAGRSSDPVQPAGDRLRRRDRRHPCLPPAVCLYRCLQCFESRPCQSQARRNCETAQRAISWIGPSTPR